MNTFSDVAGPGKKILGALALVVASYGVGQYDGKNEADNRAAIREIVRDDVVRTLGARIERLSAETSDVKMDPREKMEMIYDYAQLLQKQNNEKFEDK